MTPQVEAGPNLIRECRGRSPSMTAMSPKYAAAALLGVLLFVAVSSCTGSDSDDSDAEVRPTPIDQFHGSTVTIGRAEFCDAVPEAAVQAAVGDVDSVDSYANGERARITRHVRDVSHEFSCTWVGDRGDVARAWVFAPRVTPAQARGLVREAKRAKGCRVLPRRAFGSPSAGTLCTVGGHHRASYRGLFVDAWLACSLTDGGRQELSPRELVDRAGTWCVQAALAASS